MIGLALLAAAGLEGSKACALPSGWSQIEAQNPRFIIFGETHGTRESAELLGSIACALSKRSAHILVAVELGASTDPQLQRLWNAPSGEFRKRLLAELPFFARRKDGVGSEAMLALIDRLHSLAHAGKKIGIVAFSGARDADQAQRWLKLPSQAAHEAMQAENIANAATQKGYRRVLVLVGNAHAQKQPIHEGKFQYKPMAMRLAPAGRVISLLQTYASGTMWNCIERTCGMHSTSGTPARPRTQIGLWPTRQHGWNAGYDGYYWFPVVHGSPPATVADEADR